MLASRRQTEAERHDFGALIRREVCGCQGRGRLVRVLIVAAYFLTLLLEAVILLVLMRSPMYFCKNLLLLSSLSCSSRTASIRLKMSMRESCSALACLHRG